MDVFDEVLYDEVVHELTDTTAGDVCTCVTQRTGEVCVQPCALHVLLETRQAEGV